MYTSATRNLEIMSLARRSLSGKWLLAIVMFIALAIYQVIVNFIPFIGFIIILLFAGPLAVGFNRFSLTIARGNMPEASIVLSGFNNFITNLIAAILIAIYIFLWLLLLIIPGIIKAFAYSQTFYLLAEYPEMSANSAITKSREMMVGNKLKLFGLSLYLLCLVILCLVTLGIGFIWYMPYQSVVLARFYDDLKLM